MDVKQAMDSIENWFNAREYQQWSMVNNNNGLKIRNTLASYKYIQRKYIYDFDKNDWYFHFKTKLESLSKLNKRNRNDEYKKMMVSVVGMTDKYEYVCIPQKGQISVHDVGYKGKIIDGPEVRSFFEEKLINYEIDWLND